MSTVNVMAREIAAKIVFYGPGLSGKTTTLKRIYETVKPSLRGELMTLPTEADRTLFFDFLPVRVERVGDYALRLALYTVPGQVFYNATRKLVLQGSDGVVFVADSNPGAQDANRESMANLEENLAGQGISLDSFPLVIQLNKRDLGNAVPLEQMRALLNRRNVPDFETVAMSGEGVLDAMKAMIRLVIKDLRARKIVPSSKPRPSAPQPSLSKDLGASLEAQVQEHLVHQRAPEPMPAPHGIRALGPVAALAPGALIDPARVAEMCFASGDFEGCVRTCLETLQRGLAFAGESSIAHQSFLLGLNGRDVLDAYTRSQRGASNIEDASFALFVLAQLFVRLTQAGLPTPEQ